MSDLRNLPDVPLIWLLQASMSIAAATQCFRFFADSSTLLTSNILKLCSTFVLTPSYGSLGAQFLFCYLSDRFFCSPYSPIYCYTFFNVLSSRPIARNSAPFSKCYYVTPFLPFSNKYTHTTQETYKFIMKTG